MGVLIILSLLVLGIVVGLVTYSKYKNRFLLWKGAKEAIARDRESLEHCLRNHTGVDYESNIFVVSRGEVKSIFGTCMTIYAKDPYVKKNYENIREALTNEEVAMKFCKEVIRELFGRRLVLDEVH